METYTIALRQMEFYAYHGLYEHEQQAGNTFLVDAEVQARNLSPESDQIGETVNYEDLYAAVQQVMEQPKHLLETLCHQILEAVEAHQWPLLSSKVVIWKKNPPLQGPVAWSEVQLERTYPVV